MRDVAIGTTKLVLIVGVVGASGCADAWRAWWEARGDDGEPPVLDGGAPADAGATNDASVPSDAGAPDDASASNDAGAGAACGSRGLPPCAEGQFCDFPEANDCGDTDQGGTCRDKPEICTFIYSPVCGCDGNTYGNACEAAAAGVSVRSTGECAVDAGAPESCGGLLGLQCPGDEYCSYPPDAMCGRADATGVCTERPDACTREYFPVCGCDGLTYGNACTAAAAGVSVEHEGACPGATCGGIAGVACPEGQYCDYAAGDGCEVADGQGRCAVMPELCTDIYEPVCGCNGETYGNACYAAAAGASVRSEGQCPTLQ